MYTDEKGHRWVFDSPGHHEMHKHLNHYLAEGVVDPTLTHWSIRQNPRSKITKAEWAHDLVYSIWTPIFWLIFYAILLSMPVWLKH